MFVSAGNQMTAIPSGIPGAGAQPQPLDEIEVAIGDDIDLDPSDSAPSLAELAHDANLAEHLSPTLLSEISADLLEGVEADIESNSEQTAIYEKGVELLGVGPIQRTDWPFPNASGAYHPLLLEAVVRFNATARGEMLPSAGPVKTMVIGGGQAAEQISQRKQQWLNYYLTEVDEGYYPDFDQMLLLLPLHGSMFRKVFADPLRQQPRSRYLTPQNLIVAYNTTSLQGCGRVTQIDLVSHVDLVKMQLNGLWRDLDLQEPTEQELPGQASIDRTEGRARTQIIGDDRHTVFHVHCMLDIPGLEHVGPDGIPSGLPLPYIATIDRDSQQVLRLSRNWEPNDAAFEPREWFVHYQFMPGLGFYGWGLVHLLGASADAATSLRRQVINSFTLATFPGGFRAKGARQEQNDNPIGPCEFREIDLAGLPSIQAAVMPLPYKEPPASWPSIEQSVVGAAQRLGNTMDMNVGEGKDDAPVGTTMALIEKATRVETAVIKRLHTAHRKELRLLAKLFSKEPNARYPYIVNGQVGQALAQDFADNADIVPVSDPNLPTQTQRLALAQAKLQMAQQFPALINAQQALNDMLSTMGVTDQDIQRLAVQPQPGQPLDPISEFQVCLKGMPLVAGPQQAHQAHIVAHQSQAALLIQQQNQPAAQALAAHIAEHLGLLYRQQLQAMAPQVPLPPMGQPLPPQLEAQLSQAVAQATGPVMQQIMQTLAPPQQQGPGQGLRGRSPEEIALQQESNKLKAQALVLSQADAQRKAEESARQDQVELIKLQAQERNDAADRAQRQQDNQVKLLLAGINNGQQQEQNKLTALGHVTDLQNAAAKKAQHMAQAVQGVGKVMDNATKIIAKVK